MGWYSAVGKPLFFAIPPEAAHRLAGALLGLPLPWESVAGRPRGGATVLAGVPLANPIGLAAGFDKSCAHLDTLGRLGFGYVVGGTITWEPRRGNPRPRIVRYPQRGSMVNAMGLPNPGAEVAARNLSVTPALTPRFASLADEAGADVAATVELLGPLVDGIELNASCPNVSWGRDRDDEAHLAELLKILADYTDRPVFVKLPPFVHPREREGVLAMAMVAAEGGAAGLTCSNTRPVDNGRLATGRGGLSGRALWEHTTRIVAEVHDATGGQLPINACGGVSCGADVRACLDAGATSVQVYTALIFEGPRVVGHLLEGSEEPLPARA